jgi:hypothetical protein
VSPGGGARLSGCGQAPSWIAAGALPVTARSLLSACFAAGSNQAEALVSVNSNRDYAQLITVGGAGAGLVRSSLPDALGAGLAALLAGAGTEGAPRALVLRPYGHVTFTVDRPAGLASRQIEIALAQGVPSALAGRVWTFLSAARARGLAAAGIESCLAVSLAGALSPLPAPSRLLSRMRLCVRRGTPSDTHVGRVLRGLASGLLSERLLVRAVAREGHGQPGSEIALTIPASAPGPVNPGIRVLAPSIPAVSDGRRTVEHLSASGGTAPYRFYLLGEPGAPNPPSWVTLAPDGTLTIAPPDGVSLDVSLTVYVIDADGDYSQEVP